MIRIENAIARNPEIALDGPVDLVIPDGETVAIVGPNGAGKSLLAGYITGRTALRSGSVNRGPGIRLISFRDVSGAADSGYYLQQRWNSTEYDLVPLVKESLGNWRASAFQEKVFSVFNIAEQLEKPLVLLSSGELRKFQIARVLLGGPRTLIVDNPFIGLDKEMREKLTELFRELAAMPELQLIVVLPESGSVPDFVTRVIEVRDRKVVGIMAREEYLLHRGAVGEEDYNSLDHRLLSLPDDGGCLPGSEVVRLNGVSIRYGSRTILKDLDWTVLRGERWALTGANGSGKSTLLSLVCADNPQSYACDIRLFGHKRGSGETIWDIKKHIGYVSPELHRAYDRNVPVLDIVASGLHDRNGLYLPVQESQIPACRFWMDVFGISGLEDRMFTQISSGEQRLALLARAFVKDPDLLILDEPFHGLDSGNAARVKHIIEAFCSRPGKTLIMVSHFEDEFPSSITNHLHLSKIA